MTLASLLPGLREIRAALVSGYVYLFALALMFGDHVPDRKHATGVLRTLWDLREAASPLGVAIAISVAAYLVGSFAEAAFAFVAGRRRFARVPAEQLSVRGYQMLGEVTDQVVRNILRNLADHDQNFISARAPGVLQADSALFKALTEAARLAPDFHEFSTEAESEEALEDGLRIVVSNTIIGRLGVLPIRLLGQDPDLYSSLDRLKSEAELRQFLVPALGACVAALVCRASALWLAALVPVALLWEQSKLRTRQSGDLAIEALLLERLSFPELDRMKKEALAPPPLQP